MILKNVNSGDPTGIWKDYFFVDTRNGGFKVSTLDALFDRIGDIHITLKPLDFPGLMVVLRKFDNIEGLSNYNVFEGDNLIFCTDNVTDFLDYFE